MKTWYIYLITNTLSGKKYVGQRLYNGDPLTDTTYMGSGCAIKPAIKKYGKKKFKKEILEFNIENQEDANFYEQFFIDQLKTLSPLGYNLNTGGRQNCIISKETREKILKSRKRIQIELKKNEAWIETLPFPYNELFGPDVEMKDIIINDDNNYYINSSI